MIHLTGKLICADEAQAGIVRTYLPEHIRLTRAEPGCERFEVTQAGPLVWDVAERFTDRVAFEAHQARSRDSAWGRASAGIARDFTIRED
ncbi:MAG: antibiotic biosynthesis monooxygenase [Rhodobacter sp.]|nr:antibiotic biosynthesis monooxygenase [Paracoccaceae bacterium]MCC0077202.1 antibiotic biosynthesis monooxygenase [Rhodobacter sp.]